MPPIRRGPRPRGARRFGGDPPGVEGLAGHSQVEEAILVDAVIAEPPVEVLDEDVLYRLARLDAIGPNALAPSPIADRLVDQIGTVVQSDLQDRVPGLGVMVRQARGLRGRTTADDGGPVARFG